MENRVEKAEQLYKKGYNCAQAVVCAYCDKFGIDEETAYRMAEGFGGGMGMMETCGAVTGAFMVAGMKKSAGTDEPGKTKAQTYKINRQITEEFKEKNSTIICRELKGVEDGKVKRECAGCIQDACEILEKIL